MLRHIILASLAMTACATFMPTKANAIELTLTPVGSLQRNPGDTIAFVLQMDPGNDVGLYGVPIKRIYDPTISNFRQGTIYDSNELSLARVDRLVEIGYRVTRTMALATFIFDVVNPIKDGWSDLSARVDYRADQAGDISVPVFAYGGNSTDVQPIPEPIPEPLTIFGTATGLGCGALFKRKFSKKTVA
jgi:hypothetical protein